MFSKRFLMASVIGVFHFSAAQVYAGVITQVTATVTYNSVQSIYDYSYLLTNPVENASDGDPDLFLDFSVEVPLSADLTNIITPAGWFNTFYSSGDTLIEWAVDDFTNNVLLPGDSLTFGFSSPFSEGDAVYGVVALNAGGGEFASGNTLAPTAPASAVPEPSSMALFLVAVAGMFVFGRRGGRGFHGKYASTWFPNARMQVSAEVE